MSLRGAVSKWGRVGFLVLLVAFALTALFIPGGLIGDSDPVSVDNESDVDQPIHNLAFGLNLDGGARISAPPVGMMVEDIEPTTSDPRSDLRSALIDELGLPPEDARVRAEQTTANGRQTISYTAEVFDGNVTAEEFAAAVSTVDGVDVSADAVQDGVTEATRQEMIQTLQSKLNEAGLSGGSVYQTERLNGQHFIVSEAPGYTTSELESLLEERGTVRIEAHYPDPDGDGLTNETVLEQEDFTNVGRAEYDSETSQWEVGVNVVSETAPEFQARMNELGFTREGQGQCSRNYVEDGQVNMDEWSNQYCLVTISGDEVVSAHSMGDLAEGMRAGTWANNPTFQMTSNERAEAQQLSINLRAGALTAPLDFGDAQYFSVQPALAQQFKSYSLLIGILSVLAVSATVFVRYRDRRVALPMILTAMAEVLILLGVAATAGMAIDLAHVAGFIAVVGTGVDDLIIIADEVMDEGDVSQGRVFDTRFRKAFWIIGAAAATTIIAMSPLAVMSLGDLRGFAIITILGVLIGVFVTRPAYGDILRKLMTRGQ
ncbi:preprotein translocase subunit SecD [Halovivax limisalsi]|uniref:preprotein translocase subunit SecD n=1 Tax=Halovivax limisalsi TaxID=1453760 RepID=UPI001FFDC074|nr:preprotein translocase subunit SecD [Halovivax limisalsi]